MHGLIVWFIGGGLLAATVVKLFLFDQPRRPARNMTWTWSTSGASPELKLRWTPWSYMCATTTIRGVSASRRATICATGATCCGRLCCSRSARLGRSPGGSRAALRSSRRRGVAKEWPVRAIRAVTWVVRPVAQAAQMDWPVVCPTDQAQRALPWMQALPVLTVKARERADVPLLTPRAPPSC